MRKLLLKKLVETASVLENLGLGFPYRELLRNMNLVWLIPTAGGDHTGTHFPWRGGDAQAKEELSSSRRGVMA